MALTVTTTLPVVAPLGTVTAMLVLFQPEAVPALAPLKVTALAPWGAPKLLPAIMTTAPTAPEAGDKVEMTGRVVTVNKTPLLARPLAVTTTLPVLAPVGTVTVMLESLQLVGVAALIPLKTTVLLPWVAPKPLPLMVTAVPAGPAAGDKPEMFGTGTSVIEALAD